MFTEIFQYSEELLILLYIQMLATQARSFLASLEKIKLPIKEFYFMAWKDFITGLEILTALVAASFSGQAGF